MDRAPTISQIMFLHVHKQSPALADCSLANHELDFGCCVWQFKIARHTEVICPKSFHFLRGVPLSRNTVSTPQISNKLQSRLPLLKFPSRSKKPQAFAEIEHGSTWHGNATSTATKRKGRVPAAMARRATGKRGSAAAAILESPSVAASTCALSGLRVAERSDRSSSPAAAAAAEVWASTSMKCKP